MENFFRLWEKFLREYAIKVLDYHLIRIDKYQMTKRFFYM